MSILIFFIILSALVIVHELGHFLVAKYFKIRVDEFGLGFPPRAKTLFHWKGTPFTLNWLPFGGFVKIFGENPEDSDLKDSSSLDSSSFQNKNRGIQSAVLVAGVVGNLLFAWLLFSIGFMSGVPAPVGYAEGVRDAHVVITGILHESPAGAVGLRSGDTILSLGRGEDIFTIGEDTIPSEVSDFISNSLNPITFEIKRGANIFSKVVTPKEGIIPDKPAVGFSMDLVGILQYSPLKALVEGAKTTWQFTILITQGIGKFVVEAVGGRADLSQVTGPVGIVGMVGDVRVLGFSYLLSFTALISINLAVINLLPFPALDGGRLLFVAIEAIRRRSVSPRIFNALNTAGFALLLLLMLLVTIQDIRNIL